MPLSERQHEANRRAFDIATALAIEKATEKAEQTIRKALLDLEHATMKRVDHVNIDTRNYANCKTEVFLK
jgi:hypothetical protein